MLARTAARRVFSAVLVRRLSKYSEPFLRQRAANHTPLTPLSFLERAALVWPERAAVRFEGATTTYAELHARARRLASALRGRGVGEGDTVTVFAANTPPCLEAHYGVPGAGAVLHTVNTRLDAATVAYMIEHAETKVLVFEPAFAAVVREALGLLSETAAAPLLVEAACGGEPESGTVALTYEALLEEGDASAALLQPGDEWDAIALNYTSGTSGRPKGVVYHHRGCYLQAASTPLFWDMGQHPVFLWVSPMFHCCGWHFPWTTVALGGTQVCLRAPLPAEIFRAVRDEGVTHLGGAPTVLTMLAGASDGDKAAMAGVSEGGAKVRLLTAGSPPAPATLRATEAMGFEVTHMYGLTETFGQCLSSVRKPEYAAAPEEEQAALKARQGVPVPLLGGRVAVARAGQSAPEHAGEVEEVGRGTEEMGEILVRARTERRGSRIPESSLHPRSFSIRANEPGSE